MNAYIVRVKDMIEAVNSSLVSAAITQKAAVVQASAKSVTSEKVQVSETNVEGFYLSRNVRVDNTSKVAVLEFRNPLNGDVKTQIPTEAQLKAYEVADAREAAELAGGDVA